MTKKVGRPKKTEDEAYNVKVAILLTKKEKALIEKNASKLDFSVNKYLRNIIFSNLK